MDHMKMAGYHTEKYDEQNQKKKAYFTIWMIPVDVGEKSNWCTLLDNSNVRKGIR